MEFLFALCLSFLAAHELDAMRGREWRILPGLNRLSDTQGRDLFIALHVPLFFALLCLCWHEQEAVEDTARFCVALFGVAHLVLHQLFSDHPEYDFSAPLSQALIVGYAVIGGIYATMSVLLF